MDKVKGKIEIDKLITKYCALLSEAKDNEAMLNLYDSLGSDICTILDKYNSEYLSFYVDNVIYHLFSPIELVS